jgi:glycosyltransferase involved in cell wall biosynthesis
LSPLSIAIVSVSGVPGGAEAHTVALGQGLRARGHGVALYGRCPGWDATGLPGHAIGLGPKWSRRTLAAGVLRVPLERHRARAVPTPSVFYLQFKREQIALTRTLSRKAPVVWCEHGRWLDGPAGRLLLRAYGRAATYASRIACVSAAVADDLRRVVDPAKLVVVPNAVDTSRYAQPSGPHRAELRRRLVPEHLQDRTVGVLASRLHPAKRHQRAIAAALASGSGLLVLGDGPARPDLERAAAGHPDVVFLGQRANVPDYLGAADFYLFCGTPSAEGMPTAVLEAAACGLPVVGFAGDPCLDLVDRCGGLTVADPAELTTERLAGLLPRRGDGAGYVREHHGRDVWLDRFESIFRECSR